MPLFFTRIETPNPRQLLPSYSKSLPIVVSNKRLWVLVLYIGFISVSLIVLTNNWQLDMLKKLYHIKNVEAVTINAMVMLGYIMRAFVIVFYNR